MNEQLRKICGAALMAAGMTLLTACGGGGGGGGGTPGAAGVKTAGVATPAKVAIVPAK